MTEIIESKIINKKSTLEEITQISKGDIVETVGVVSSLQHDKGKVIYSDQVAGMLLVGAREGDDIVVRSYFYTPMGVKSGSKVEVYRPSSSQFLRYDLLLREEGL